uniref:SEA domain-containing protein n=1 Tax=Monodelphis domestica TaxID=13616 RepID=A0A5F8HEC4_MONDO
MANYEKTSGNRNKNNMNLSIRTPTVATTTGNPKSISSTIHQIATSGPNNNHSSISQSITISQSTSHHPAVVIAENSMFFLSFRILSKNFNSSLENPSSLYYQELKNSLIRDWNSKTSSTGSSVPGYGIALLVIVCILASSSPDILGLCQFRRKHCGQLDIFPSQDSYHPMNEYPLYHTHGRYVPPGNTKRSPYEEISPGNGGNSLSYVNPVATSANL